MPWLQSHNSPTPGLPWSPQDGKTVSLTCVSREFPADLDIALTGFEAIDRAHVVQPPTRHKVPRWGIGTGHDPGGAQRDGMYLQEVRVSRGRTWAEFPGG